MKDIKDFMVNESWSDSQRINAERKMRGAFQKNDPEEMFQLIWDTFTDDELKTLYDEMEAGGYF